MPQKRPQPKSTPKKIVYLLGAGATHAELTNLDPKFEENEEKLGLLIKNVSGRVMERVQRDKGFWNGIKVLKQARMVSGVTGSPNIELFISLIESSKTHDWEYKARKLKDLVRKDIESRLTPARTRRFYLHRGLLTYHSKLVTQAQERLCGLISLNYDEVLDDAYRECIHRAPNYCLGPGEPSSVEKRIPLLKLHGSFGWDRIIWGGRKRSIEIIPLGSSKNYLHPPYNFIWDMALRVLIECDTLRVIGCSMSQNDLHLIDLFFKAHVERNSTFDIEIIDNPNAAEMIRRNYGFFPKIVAINDKGGPLGPDPSPANPFKTWLKYKIIDTVKAYAKRTQYLRAVID